MGPVREKSNVKKWPFVLGRKKSKRVIRPWRSGEFYASWRPLPPLEVPMIIEGKSSATLPFNAVISPVRPEVLQVQSPEKQYVVLYEKLFGRSPVTPPVLSINAEDGLGISEEEPTTPQNSNLPRTPDTPSPMVREQLKKWKENLICPKAPEEMRRRVPNSLLVSIDMAALSMGISEIMKISQDSVEEPGRGVQESMDRPGSDEGGKFDIQRNVETNIQRNVCKKKRRRQRSRNSRYRRVKIQGEYVRIKRVSANRLGL